MGKTLKYVKEFDFSSAGKTVGMARGGACNMAEGGSVKPRISAMTKRAMVATPTMEKKEVVQRSSVKAPAAPQGMLRDASALGIRGNKNPGIKRKAMPVAPREPMIPAYKIGGAVPKAGAYKIPKVMSEYKAGELHSGSKSGPVVKNRKQALAIALSEARAAGKKK
jgi:hypothetical protein